jgi:hypothetical protein
LNLQLEDGTIDLFSKTFNEDGLEIGIQGIEKPQIIGEFIQAWHNQIWEYGFMGWFN